ncbi:MAG: hypothetical protein JWN51_391 [Phycisphaerales bacterium]|nr:hypothetical protein [Phycisphaerales bacterium]
MLKSLGSPFRVFLIAVVLAAFAGAGVYAYRVFYNVTPEQALTERLADVKFGMPEAEVDAMFGKPDKIENNLHPAGFEGPYKRKSWQVGRASVEVEFNAGKVAFKHARTRYDFPTGHPTTR